MRHLLSLFDLSDAEFRTVLDAATTLKRRLAQGDATNLLAGRVIGLLFEKPSLRTRVSFEAGIARLGGATLFLGTDVGWGHRESPRDFTRVLGAYLDAVVCRAKSHAKVEELARFDALHVINGLTDLCHPCQALADLMTVRECFGNLNGRHLVFVGDGNNVSRSLALACALAGMRFTLAGPEGYRLDDAWIGRIRERCPRASLEQTADAKAAVRDADVIYTDVWTSMGQEAERAERLNAFSGYRVDETLLAAAPRHVRVLHCLPANRGEEISDAVIDGPHSAILQEAENRMHAQNGLLAWLLAPEWVAQHVPASEAA